MSPFRLIAIRRRLAPLLIVLPLGAASAGVAHAAPKDAAMAAELEVAAAPNCTTRADVMARVRTRAPRVTFGGGSHALAIRARFSVRADGSVTGELTLSRADATTATRTMVAASCAEAADAVALIIAVTLDPTAADRSEHGVAAGTGAAAATTEAAGEPSTPSSKNGSTDVTSRTQPPVKPKESPPALRTNTTEMPPVPNSVPSSGAASRSRFGFSIAGQALAGPTPGVMPGVALYASASTERWGPLSPGVFLGLSHAWRSSVEAPGGTASFFLDAVSLDACPVRVRLSVFEVWPCASALGGRFSARGAETQNAPDERVRPYWVLGGAVTANVALVWQLEASIRLGVGANLVRDSFEFTPVVFHTVAPVTVAASLGLGVRSR